MTTRQIFLDTETTGLSPESGDRLVEIGCLEMVNRRLTGRNLHFYVNPERPGSEDAIRIHGLTDEFLADKPRFAEIADELVAYLTGAELIIHNAPFDIGFLDAEFKRLARAPTREIAAKVTDSLTMAREMFPGKSNSLDALCRRLEVDLSRRTLHGALLDAGLLAEAYIRMTRGQDSLAMDPSAMGVATASGLRAVIKTDFREFEFAAVQVTDSEKAAHEALLIDLDKASGGKTVWRRLA
jgi:DNA polymerase III subunit epsilon